ncbi:MAG: 2'-5' RNA ligase family protein [Cyanobacteria bacterium P01_D01_bin.105]
MDNTKSVELNESSERHRFFIALLPPHNVQVEANKIKAIMRDDYASKAAFRSPPHITLHAPFEWPLLERHKLNNVLSQFAAAQSPVPITLDGFNAFKPHVIYINVVKREGLMALQPKLLDVMEETLGIVSKSDRHRNFVPHLTVAFRDLKPAMFRKAWAVFQHREIHFDFVAQHLALLIHDGKLWQIEEKYAFEGID